jgi:hypothetical protein
MIDLRNFDTAAKDIKLTKGELSLFSGSRAWMALQQACFRQLREAGHGVRQIGVENKEFLCGYIAGMEYVFELAHMLVIDDGRIIDIELEHKLREQIGECYGPAE